MAALAITCLLSAWSCANASAAKRETVRSASFLGPVIRPENTHDPRFVERMRRRGFLYTQRPVPAGPDGRPRVFKYTRRNSVRALTPQMRAQLSRIAGAVKPRYRDRLAFLFADYYDRQYLVVFLPEDPDTSPLALNLCLPDPAANCHHECIYHLHPVTLDVMNRPTPFCSDSFPFWKKA